MQRYFFDFLDGGMERDEEGVDLPDVPAAKVAAQEALAAIVGERSTIGDDFTLTARVRDEAGHILFEAKLSVEFTSGGKLAHRP